MTEADERAAVIAEALTWIGTPYRHLGRIKGEKGCVDCAQFVWAVFYACGLTPFMEQKDYPSDWYLHGREELFLAELMGRAEEVSPPQPGDVAMFKVGRMFAHGAIVMPPGWPHVIHARATNRMVALGRADQGDLVRRETRFFSRWPKSSATTAPSIRKSAM